MAGTSPLFPPLLLILLFVSGTVIRFSHHAADAYAIGVNYGTVADNLPPPARVAAFLKEQTFIDRIKLFDADPNIIRAFANTGIAVTVSTLNGDIPALAKLPAAQAWVAANVLPFHPQTLINRVAVGNEVLATADRNLIAHLLPAMRSLHAALRSAGISNVEVTTPHSLGILSRSEPASTGRFRRGYDTRIFAPILDFHRRTNSSFMVNPYPYFGFSNRTLNYALFRPNEGIVDKFTGVRYRNMFDAQMDAVYSAMKRLGYGDVTISLGETGWPSAGDPGQLGVSAESAMSYNANLVKHVSSGVGTPLMPNRTFETFIFSLFNEDLKPTVSEQNFGLFKPDLTPVYDVGILRSPQGAGPTASPSPAAQAPSTGAGRMWCMPKPDASEDALQGNIDYACRFVDCKPIQSGGSCFDPDTVRSHAAYAMNAYYQTQGRQESDCNFAGTGILTSGDPSYQACKYVS